MKIHFNGQEYDNLESMPSDVRTQYLQVIQILGDKNQNGIPDMIEKGNFKDFTQKITLNGKEYNSVTEMPSDVREVYEKLQSLPLASAQTQIDVHTTHIGDFKFPTRAETQLFNLTAHSGPSGGMWKIVVFLAVLLVITIVLWASGIKFSDIFLH